MKRRLELIIIVLCLMCGLLACGEKKGKDKSSESAETTENVTFSGKETESPSPEWVAALSQAKDAKQLFVICAHGTSTAWVSMHEKDENGKWKMIMSTPGFIGRNGLGKTKEGDGMTPVGTFSFNRAFGIADDPGCAIPSVKVDDDYYWSGDVNNGMHYNELVKLSEYPALNVDDSEHIVDYAYEYRYCLNISYNVDCLNHINLMLVGLYLQVRDGGSARFRSRCSNCCALRGLRANIRVPALVMWPRKEEFY